MRACVEQSDDLAPLGIGNDFGIISNLELVKPLTTDIESCEYNESLKLLIGDVPAVYVLQWTLRDARITRSRATVDTRSILRVVRAVHVLRYFV